MSTRRVQYAAPANAANPAINCASINPCDTGRCGAENPQLSNPQSVERKLLKSDLPVAVDPNPNAQVGAILPEFHNLLLQCLMSVRGPAWYLLQLNWPIGLPGRGRGPDHTVKVIVFLNRNLHRAGCRSSKLLGDERKKSCLISLKGLLVLSRNGLARLKACEDCFDHRNGRSIGTFRNFIPQSGELSFCHAVHHVGLILSTQPHSATSADLRQTDGAEARKSIRRQPSSARNRGNGCPGASGPTAP